MNLKRLRKDKLIEIIERFAIQKSAEQRANEKLAQDERAIRILYGPEPQPLTAGRAK